MKWFEIMGVAGLGLALVGASVQADEAPDWQDGVLAGAADLLEPNYIYEDRANQLGDFLREDPARYASIADKDAFARAVTHDLYGMTSDAHLRLFYRPENPEDEPNEAGRVSRCARGDIEHERLAGNVGYIRVPTFSSEDAYIAQIDAAFAAQNDADALVIDLRNNCGGGPRPVRQISTYLFDEVTHLASTEMRDQPVRERWTFEDVPGPRFPDRPVLVLTNDSTFSAAESFTFGLKVTGRALTVGEGTGGGGHFGSVQRISEDFTLFVPVGRTFDPRTGQGWEAEGIQPDIPAASDDALDVALAYLATL